MFIKRGGVAKMLFNEHLFQLTKDFFGSDETFEFVFKLYSFNTSIELRICWPHWEIE
jgi:hypothetical protein